MLFLSPIITVYILVLAFIMGAVFASFLACLGWRMCKGESILKGRSHCDTCGHVLGVRDLIPIISYLIHKGRCVYCKETISIANPIGELVLAVTFVLLTIRYDVCLELALMLFFACILFLVSVTDIQNRIIPDSCLILAVIVRLIYYFGVEGFSFPTLGMLVIDGLSVSLPLLLLTLFMEQVLKKEAMGGGDIKLIFVIGLYLGWQQNLFMILVACVIGIIVGTVRAGKDENGYFPFGPSIAIATVLTLLVGEALLGWYLSLF